jgi:hypothetical protein
VCVVEPIKERGMQDYRLDEIEQPERHPTAVDRLKVNRQAGALTARAASYRGARLIASRHYNISRPS